MSNTIPDWMAPTEVKPTDRDRPNRRDPREGAKRQQPPRKPSGTTEKPEPDGSTPHIGILIDVRA